MELEYKWHISEDFGKIISDSFVHGLSEDCGITQMDSRYYDTEDTVLKTRFRAALRLRRENEKSVICLKMPKRTDGAFAAREEYEAESDNIENGLIILPRYGAPLDLCEEIASLPLRQIARVSFARHSFRIRTGSFSAELSFDEGFAERHLGQFHSSPIAEIELEFKSGNVEYFHKWAAEFERHFKLKPIKLSKLAQALSDTTIG